MKPFVWCRLPRLTTKWFLLGLTWMTLSGAQTCSADEQSAETADKPILAYHEKTLANGLRVITLEDFTCPLVNVQLWYHVGSKDENPERQGFAHMFEHMMFRGTDRLGPKDHFELVRRTGGSCNAYTSFDQTVYHETVPASQLELALWLEAERMAFLKIDQSGFDTERKVVEEERRMGLNRPFGSLYEQVLAALFAEHPYRWSPIGKIPHLRSAAVQELRDFWTQYYVPNNAVLVIAGAVPHARAEQLAERYFGWIGRGTDPPRITVREPKSLEGREVEILEDNAPAPLVGLVFHIPELASPDSAPVDCLLSILVGDDSSRLYRLLVAEKQLAIRTIQISNSMEQDGLAGIAAIVPPLVGKPDEVLNLIRQELKRLADEPVTERELTKAKNQEEKTLVASLLTVEGKARLLGTAAVLEGDLDRPNRRLAEIRALTAADLQRVAREYFNPQTALTFRVKAKPGGQGFSAEDASPITAEVEVEPPPPGRAGITRPSGYLSAAPASGGLELPTGPPESHRETLPNGLKLIVVPNHELPIVTVQLGLKAGAWTESKPGVASLALGMLTKGTAKHSEAELADELGTLAISLAGMGGMDGSSVVASCLTAQLPRTMQLLAEVTLEPAFSETEFSKHRAQVFTDLQVATAAPAYLAQKSWKERVFGAHPYARSADGEPADVQQVTVDDVKSWWHTFARPDQAVLIFAGDVTPETARTLAEKYLGGWKADTTAPSVELAAIPPAQPTRIVIIDRPTATQSQIFVGQASFDSHSPLYFPSRVVSAYFGGAFNSRLNETIRVQRGLTYGARGGFSAERFGGQFTVSTFSKTESTDETVSAIFEELARLKTQPPTEKELTDTKSYFIGSYPLQRETPQQIAGDFWAIELEDLPADFFEQEVRAVAQTTADECTRLVSQAIDADKLLVVVVGSAAEIKEPLEKIAPVEVISAP